MEASDHKAQVIPTHGIEAAPLYVATTEEIQEYVNSKIEIDKQKRENIIAGLQKQVEIALANRIEQEVLKIIDQEAYQSFKKTKEYKNPVRLANLITLLALVMFGAFSFFSNTLNGGIFFITLLIICFAQGAVLGVTRRRAIAAGVMAIESESSRGLNDNVYDSKSFRFWSPTRRLDITKRAAEKMTSKSSSKLIVNFIDDASYLSGLLEVQEREIISFLVGQAFLSGAVLQDVEVYLETRKELLKELTPQEKQKQMAVSLKLQDTSSQLLAQIESTSIQFENLRDELKDLPKDSTVGRQRVLDQIKEIAADLNISGVNVQNLLDSADNR